MKTLLDSWDSFTNVSLLKSSVPLDVKIVVMNMYFCLIRIAELDEPEIETIFRSLCQRVIAGIQNIIQSSHEFSGIRVEVLGLGVNVKEELKVSCICIIV